MSNDQFETIVISLSDAEDDRNASGVPGRANTSNSIANLLHLNRSKSVPPAKGSTLASPDYFRQAKVPSRPTKVAYPLVIISIEAVLCAHLPPHLSGGHTSFLSRTYLHTLMDYLLDTKTPWNTAFWTGSMSRKDALETLRQLGLPTGGPEKNERDGVVGVWALEDCRRVPDSPGGSQLTIKDLNSIWDDLEVEEGLRWGVQNTIVITDKPEYMAAQPLNYVIAPSFHYRTTVPFFDDQYLFMLIAVLEDLSTESNFAQHAQAQKWSNLDFWQGLQYSDQRDRYIAMAVRICAKRSISIVAAGGN